MSNPGLKAVCRYPGDADILASAMTESGFIERDGDDGFSVPKWREKNAQLVNSWENGRKGGRPKKKPEKPTGNPKLTHGNQRREEKRREDKGSTAEVDHERVRKEARRYDAVVPAKNKHNLETLYKVASLRLRGTFSEGDVADSLEGVRTTSPTDRFGYWYECLRDRIPKFEFHLASLTLPKELTDDLNGRDS